MIELIRRLVALICLCAAIASALTPTPVLLRVTAIDFSKRQQDELLSDTRKLPIDQYIAQETEDWLIGVSGTGWNTLYAQAIQADAGGPVDEAWRPRLNWGWLAGTDFYFRPDESPVNTIAGQLNDSRTFTYVALPGEPEPRYLGVTFVRPHDAIDDAPDGLLYPYRAWSIWLLLAGIAVYALLPRRKTPPDSLVCHRMRAIVLPDLVGYMLAGAFFALPFFIIPSNATVPNLLDFDDGWGVLTLVFWGLALGGVVMLYVAARYAAYCIDVLPERLRVTTLSGVSDYPYNNMAIAQTYVQRLPRWLVIFSYLMVIFSFRALGPAALLASTQNIVMEVVCMDGRQLHVPLTTLAGGKRLIDILRQKGVRIDASLVELAKGAE